MVDSGGVLNCVVETWAPDGGCHTAASNHQALLRLFTLLVSIDHTCGQGNSEECLPPFVR